MIDVEASLAALSLAEKCRLLAGKSTWRTKKFPAAGVPQIKVSDGPNGVRGEGHGSMGTPGVVVPSGITLGATWDVALLEEIGDLVGREARRKRAHVLLAPTVNLHRTPVGGRTFECYSEDPELTGALAAAYVRGVQSNEVAVTVKHFACNDTEIERMSVDVEVDERPLRELYLRPFERAVKDGGAWGIMSAYNRLSGDHCAENRDLLTGILRDEWGFDGFVVSDWFGVHDTVGAANAGLTLEMPAPVRVSGDHLVGAVERGDVAESQVDGLVREILVLANRTHADERDPDEPEESVDDPTERALTRRAATAGTVLLRNADVDSAPLLPLETNALSSIAVIGPNAVVDRSMGGGSASLVPFRSRTLLDAVTDRIGPGTAADASIVYEPGVRIDKMTPVASGTQLRQPNSEPGLRISYVNGLDWNGDVVIEQPTNSSLVRFFGSTPEGVDSGEFSARIDGSFIPEVDGRHEIGIVGTGPITMRAGNGDAAVTIVDDPEAQLPRSEEFFGRGSVEVIGTVDCRAGEPVPLSIGFSAALGFAAVRVGFRRPDPADLLERAVAAAAGADVAIVVVGTNDEWETEGSDRTTMNLPGRQDELVRRCVAANPRTAVIVNAGSPVTMDWADDTDTGAAPAVLTSFFAGQEQAEGLVDVLLGEADPGGRLPTTYPVRLEDHPAYLHHHPDHDASGRGVQRYGEGLFVGYRAYDALSLPTRFPFGHGLSYGSSTWSAPTVDRTTIAGDGTVVVRVSVTSTSDRATTDVVQGYVAPVNPTCVRPPKELRDWSKVVVLPWATSEVELQFGPDAFKRWDPASGGWVVEPGEYDLVVAASAADERGRVRITIE
ncbi:MAG: glycoside hydrolase family 3 C-terminal domain-containing protein [Acidimicrobiia bacterium]|nr:glycoside hydrolase family 3 C-terminal domain-containing protein [Acidimicrobiia bacterium]